MQKNILSNQDDALDTLKMEFLLDPDMTFYTSLLCSLDVHIDNDVPTAATNGSYIKFNLQFLESLSPKERIFLMLHELGHVTGLHMFRLEGRDMARWQQATDHVINLDLIEQGYPMPSGGLADPQYKGMSAEEVYALIPENPSPNQASNDLHGSDPTATEEEVKSTVIQAGISASQSNSSNSIPGPVKRQLDEWLHPVADWRTALQKYMSAFNVEDTSWSKRNRRFEEVILPSYCGEALNSVHVFIDASGSVNQKMFNMQVGQVKWIKQNLNPAVIKIIEFDTRISSVHTFTQDEPLKDLQLSGGGGTAIGPVRDYMLEHPCDVALVFTDGFFYDEDFSKVTSPIIWAIYNNPSFTPPTGDLLIIPPGD